MDAANKTEILNSAGHDAAGTKLRVVGEYNPNYSTAPVIGSDVNLLNLDKTKTTDYAGNKVYEDGKLKYDRISASFYFQF